MKAAISKTRASATITITIPAEEFAAMDHASRTFNEGRFIGCEPYGIHHMALDLLRFRISDIQRIPAARLTPNIVPMKSFLR